LFFHQGKKRRDFIGLRWSREGETPRVVESLGLGLATFLEDALGEGAGRFHGEVFIERDERLDRRVGPCPADAGDIALGRVEGLEEGIGRGASAPGVDGASVAVLAGGFLPGEGRVARGRLEEELRSRRHHRRAAEIELEETAHGQLDVADDLALDAEARTAGEEAVARITGEQFRRDAAVLTVGARGEDEPVEMPQAPAVLHEIDGEPVEQFGMARSLALGAELLGSGDESGAEVGLPDAVDEGTRRCR
jgi:hypothetical protein